MNPFIKCAGIMIPYIVFAGSPVKFDVASLKRVDMSKVTSFGMKREISPGRLTMRHVSLGYMIDWAYGVQFYQLIGPRWLQPPTDVLFDVSATADPPVAEPTMKTMLQSLLSDRLKLSLHREQKEMPVFALTVTVNGPKLHASTDSANHDQFRDTGPFAFAARNVSMERLAERLCPPLTSRPVVDRTGLKGGFDFTLELGQYILDSETGKPRLDQNGRIDLESAVITGLPEQLGLKLQSTRALFDVIVVDHAVKDPIEN
jgi:uncharacterized protein (TIGR03435 family)